jgi:hypothetical protein
VAIALRDRFDRFDGVVGVDGVDVSAEMIAEAQRQAEGAGVDAIEWRVTAAAEIDDALGDFRLVVISDALHWMDQQAVLGYLSSTSYAGRQTLGADHEGFESDLRERLLRAEPSGRFAATMEAEWLLGWKR